MAIEIIQFQYGIYTDIIRISTPILEEDEFEFFFDNTFKGISG
jgi:hypothetical protein